MSLTIIRKFERSVLGRITTDLKALPWMVSDVVVAGVSAPFMDAQTRPEFGSLTGDKQSRNHRIKAAVLSLVLGVALLLFAKSAFGADAANDSPSAGSPPASGGFSAWMTDSHGVVVGYTGFFLIFENTWLLPIPFDQRIINGNQTIILPGFNAAMRGFTGDAYLNAGQTFSTNVIFSRPGTGTTGGMIPTLARKPTEGIDFYAQGGGPGAYLGFGHQVLGIYVTGEVSSPLPAVTLVVHTTISDEHPDVVVKDLPLSPNRLSGAPITISLTQLAFGHWVLRFGNTTLTSFKYGAAWNKGSTQGIDGVRYFTRQGTDSSGPLRWMNMSVSPPRR
jgi:hypothetical protein